MKWLLILTLVAAAGAQQADKMSVEVGEDRTAAITIPLDQTFHTAVIWGRIFSSDPRQGTTFQSANVQGAFYHKVASLAPGHYWIMVALRNFNGEGKVERAAFDIR